MRCHGTIGRIEQLREVALHLEALAARRVEVSSGVVHEPTGPPRSAEFQRFRVSDTFPTNNSMVTRTALDRSGWFDPAYDRGDRADHDLGMRLYLSGARMVMDPRIDLLHNHAPRGGLRVPSPPGRRWAGRAKHSAAAKPISSAPAGNSSDCAIAVLKPGCRAAGSRPEVPTPVPAPPPNPVRFALSRDWISTAIAAVPSTAPTWRVVL